MKYLKKYKMELIIVIFSAILISCVDDESIAENVKQRKEAAANYKRIGGEYGELVYTDPETGCQYFAGGREKGPRLGTNGFPLCGNEVPAVEQ